MLYPFLPFMMKFLIPELEDDDEAVGENYIAIIFGFECDQQDTFVASPIYNFRVHLCCAP